MVTTFEIEEVVMTLFGFLGPAPEKTLEVVELFASNCNCCQIDSTACLSY